MSTYIRVNGNDYPVSAQGNLNTRNWGGRESILAMLNLEDVAALSEIAVNPWAVVIKSMVPVYDPETGEQTGEEEHEEVYDKSDYNICGGVGIMMGKPTALESAVTSEEAENAYREGVNQA